MEIGILIGRLISYILFPVLVLGCIGLVQYFRTGDKVAARKAMFSGKSIAIALVLLILGVVGQIAN